MDHFDNKSMQNQLSVMRAQKFTSQLYVVELKSTQHCSLVTEVVQMVSVLHLIPADLHRLCHTFSL